jgi:hypothetical protein
VEEVEVGPVGGLELVVIMVLVVAAPRQAEDMVDVIIPHGGQQGHCTRVELEETIITVEEGELSNQI